MCLLVLQELNFFTKNNIIVSHLFTIIVTTLQKNLVLVLSCVLGGVVAYLWFSGFVSRSSGPLSSLSGDIVLCS